MLLTYSLFPTHLFRRKQIGRYSGFGLGVGVVTRSAHVSRSTTATAARSAREGCGCWGGVGSVSAAVVAGGVCDVGQRAGRRRGGRNGGVVMMSRYAARGV